MDFCFSGGRRSPRLSGDAYRKELWAKRIANASFSSSPVCIDGHLYGVSEDGEVFIVRAGRDYELVGRVALGQRCHASPAVGNGHLYLRTFDNLLALKAR